jgi:hypothetical protein
MGKYCRVVILAEKHLLIRTILDSCVYNPNGSTLAEHSYVGNPFTLAIEYCLSSEGPFYKSSLFYVREYTDSEPEENNNYYMKDGKEPPYMEGMEVSHPYIVNHTKKEYVVKPPNGSVHPLSFLTAQGGETVGRWVHDILSMEDDIPEEYTLYDIEEDS